MRRSRSRATLSDRVVWQSASLLLAYPDADWSERLDTVTALGAHLPGHTADLIARTASSLRALGAMRAAVEYVETFDLRRRTTMYLTYWTAGDTRNRGDHMLAFTEVYRQAGVQSPKGESPDHLPVVLEFAATVDSDAGRRLLAEHRASIDLLHDALRDADSPYAHVIAAVCHTLPAATDIQQRHAQRVRVAGPPTESVGLQPFTLTVPPRRAAGGE